MVLVVIAYTVTAMTIWSFLGRPLMSEGEVFYFLWSPNVLVRMTTVQLLARVPNVQTTNIQRVYFK